MRALTICLRLVAVVCERTSDSLVEPTVFVVPVCSLIDVGRDFRE